MPAANGIIYFAGNTTCMQKQQAQQVKQEVQLPQWFLVID